MVDRGSAHERLAAKVEAAAARAEAEERDGISYPAPGPGPAGQRPDGSGDALGELLRSPVAKDLMRTATREILRGVFKTGRR